MSVTMVIALQRGPYLEKPGYVTIHSRKLIKNPAFNSRRCLKTHTFFKYPLSSTDIQKHTLLMARIIDYNII